ncbi:type I restriction enzyme endonuclease domain-containing protein [Oerskovia sp. NPDC056781]
MAGRESIRPKLRTEIKRLLIEHGYPADKDPSVTERASPRRSR